MRKRETIEDNKKFIGVVWLTFFINFLEMKRGEKNNFVDVIKITHSKTHLTTSFIPFSPTHKSQSPKPHLNHTSSVKAQRNIICSIVSGTQEQMGQKGEEAHFLAKRFSQEATAFWIALQRKLIIFWGTLEPHKLFQKKEEG